VEAARWDGVLKFGVGGRDGGGAGGGVRIAALLHLEPWGMYDLLADGVRCHGWLKTG